MELKLDFIRQQFPSLSGPWTFFDNAGGSQTLKHVADRVRDYLLNTNVQLGGSYEISRISGERVKQGIHTMTELINAGDDREIILGSSTTALIKNLSYSLAEILDPGDEIIVTNCDHEANIGAWRALEKRAIDIKEWRINQDTLKLDLEDLETLMTPKTRLVAVTHTSNILGTINPIKEIASFVHERGALICVGGVAYAPHGLVDVQELDVDFYAFSLYKVYGPHYSLLYGKKDILEQLPGINHFFLEDELPVKFQPAHVNFELCYSLTGIREYFMEVAAYHQPTDSLYPKTLREAAAFSYKLFAHHEEKLSKKMIEFLNSQSNIQIIGENQYSRNVRVPTFSFVIDGIKSSTIPTQVDTHLIAIRYGDFYARRLITDLGLEVHDGVIRVSMVHYNTVEEVEHLIGILKQIL